MRGGVTDALCFVPPEDAVPFCAESGARVDTIVKTIVAARTALHIFNRRLHEFESLLQLFDRALDAFFFFFEFRFFIVGIVRAFTPHKGAHAVGCLLYTSDAADEL